MVERGVQTMGSELNDIRRENEWEKQREPLVFFFNRQLFSRAPVSKRLAMFDFKCARSPTLSPSCVLKPNVASAITNNDVTIVHRLHVHAK